MSFECLKCRESWDYEDYACPYCNSCAVDPESTVPLTLRYIFSKNIFSKDSDSEIQEYDVIRISTGNSVFDEAGNYMNIQQCENWK